jgi:hypothetical protein
VLVAFDDLFLRHLLKALLGRDALHIPDGLTRRLVDHAELDRVLRRHGGVHFHRDQDETQAKVA